MPDDELRWFARTFPMPVFSRAEHVWIRGTQDFVAGRRRRRAAAYLGRDGLGLTGEVAIGLVHEHDVGGLHDPPLDALQLVATAGAMRRREVSTMSATAVSDWPTPTVSTMMTSKPAASQTSMASRVRRATPPRVPPDGDGRMNAAGSRDRSFMRVLSPRIEPPERLEDGSTARTATTVAGGRQPDPDRLDERRLTGRPARRRPRSEPRYPYREATYPATSNAWY